MSSSVSERLKRARQKMGLTQQEVATALGISREQVSYFETGSRPVSLSLLNKLANIYGYPLEHFVSEQKSHEPEAVIAFRASGIGDGDLQTIAWVQRFARNLNDLCTWLEEEKPT